MSLKPLRRETVTARAAALVRAIRENDEAEIEAAVLRLSRSRRLFSPLALAISSILLLFDGVRLLVINWRLTLVQALPAMWIWLAMLDLKLHVLRGESFHVLRGPVLIPIDAAIVAITVGCFFLNAVFAFTVATSGRPQIRTGFRQARQRLAPIAVSGSIVGLLLAFSTTIVTRWGRPWFTISLGIVVGLMMVCYVGVPARLIGVKPPSQSRHERLWTALMTGLLTMTVCAPPYILGRVGILMLGSRALVIPGVIILAVGLTLQAGATGAVRAIKMSAALAAGRGVHSGG